MSNIANNTEEKTLLEYNEKGTSAEKEVKKTGEKTTPKEKQSKSATFGVAAGVAAGAMAGAGAAFAAEHISFAEKIEPEIFPEGTKTPDEQPKTAGFVKSKGVHHEEYKSENLSGKTASSPTPDEIPAEDNSQQDEKPAEDDSQQNEKPVEQEVADNSHSTPTQDIAPTQDIVPESEITPEPEITVAETVMEQPQVIVPEAVEPVQVEATPFIAYPDTKITNDGLGVVGKVVMAGAGIFVDKQTAQNIGKIADVVTDSLGVGKINHVVGKGVDIVENVVHSAHGKESPINVEKIIPTVVEHIPTVISGEEKITDVLIETVQEVIPESNEVIEHFTETTPDVLSDNQMPIEHSDNQLSVEYSDNLFL